MWRGEDGRQQHRYVRLADVETVREIVRRRADQARAVRLERDLATTELRAMMRTYRELVREVTP